MVLAAEKERLVSELDGNGHFEYRFTVFDPDATELAHFTIAHGLSRMSAPFLNTVLLTFMKESVMNSVKANLKRAFFKANNADIDNPADYESLIKEFRKEAMAQIARYVPTMEEMGLHVDVRVDLEPDSFVVTISNNTQMNANELERVKKRIADAASIRSIGEAFDKYGDETEGGGLGLLLNIMLLRSSGIGAQNYSITSKDGVTTVRVRVPAELNKPANLVAIQDRLVRELEGIPTFPETINRILALCDDPNFDFKKIAAEIEKDPSLVSGVLKLSNSSFYAVGKNISTVFEAIRVIGIAPLKNMVMVLAARKIIDAHFKTFQGFWEHAEQCGVYARQIALELKMPKAAESAYINGLLHDLGKMVLYSIDAETIRALNGLMVDRSKTSSGILEEISLGISHAEIGARMAEAWGFAPEIVDVMRHHHYPFGAEEKNRKMAAIIHVADALINIGKNQGSYIYMDPAALRLLDLSGPIGLETLHDKVKKAI